ncbi:hypothetical protein BJ138DRAFT_1132151 [Hygrophoropsis aurantiaca]|uniref:Uncharacterized protein n=1 Tax=Hygrophoropsis aurantiaca TaxID=72124 RepID=A0ACB8AUP9_9AGAM|nr:hypothetical protein BJ138DRAFT_1132151 [Hygrophoropsis aurantiaca]
MMESYLALTTALSKITNKCQIKFSAKKPQPDLILHHGSNPVVEYKNPALIMGMYPSLFPFGIGGFEDPRRPTAFYFDIPDRVFRYHHSYMFVVFSILQRRAAHLHTSFSVKKESFDRVSRELHLEQEGSARTLDREQKKALQLLNHVNTISARIPGSQAAKIFVRNEIRSYMGYFGLPILFFTANPNPAHSPIFQVMYGDETLVPAHERSLRLARDPVAAADFFDFSVSCIFKYLLGWDYKKRESSLEGGILGHVRAFYGSTRRGNGCRFFL